MDIFQISQKLFRVVLHVQDGVFQELNVFAFGVEAAELVEVPFTFDFVVNKCDNVHSFNVFLHFGLVPDVGIHATLVQIH